MHTFICSTALPSVKLEEHVLSDNKGPVWSVFGYEDVLLLINLTRTNLKLH